MAAFPWNRTTCAIVNTGRSSLQFQGHAKASEPVQKPKGFARRS
jgi:hypothetical protein